jgi:nitroreductase
MNPDELLDSLKFRYATKQFDAARKIAEAEWTALEQSLVLTPSSFGLQPWKFIVVKDAELRTRLRKRSWNQSQVTDASHFVVFTTRTDLTEEDVDRFFATLAAAQGRDVGSLAGYRNVVVSFASAMTQESRHAWNVRQAYIALGQFMTAAAMLGIDTCPMEGIEPAGYDEELGLAGTGYATSVACAVGYRSPEDKSAEVPKARFPHAEVIEHR